MVAEYGLSKKERLRHEKIIKRLFADGTSGFAYPFRYYYLIHGDASDSASSKQDTDSGITGNVEEMEPAAGVLFSVPKKMFRRANKRNLLKRRTKEAYRLNKHILYSGLNESERRVDIALVYAVREELNYRVIDNGIKKILKTIRQAL